MSTLNQLRRRLVVSTCHEERDSNGQSKGFLQIPHLRVVQVEWQVAGCDRHWSGLKDHLQRGLARGRIWWMFIATCTSHEARREAGLSVWWDILQFGRRGLARIFESLTIFAYTLRVWTNKRAGWWSQTKCLIQPTQCYVRDGLSPWEKLECRFHVL